MHGISDSIVIDCQTAEDEFINSFGETSRKVNHQERAGVLTDKGSLFNTDCIHEIDDRLHEVVNLHSTRSGRGEAEAEIVRGVALKAGGSNQRKHALELKVIPHALMKENDGFAFADCFIIHLDSLLVVGQAGDNSVVSYYIKSICCHKFYLFLSVVFRYINGAGALDPGDFAV